MKIKIIIVCLISFGVPLLSYEPLFKAVNSGEIDKVAGVINFLQKEAQKKNEDEKSFIKKHLDEQNKSGDTVLMVAANKYETDIAKMLLKAGANPDIQNFKMNGINALMYAISKNAVYMVKLLLEYKADPNAKANDGHTPLMIALYKLEKSDEDFDAAVENMTMLLKAGADPNIQNIEGRTALYILALRYRLDLMQEVVKLLLKNGASPRIPDINGITPEALAQQDGFTFEN